MWGGILEGLGERYVHCLLTKIINEGCEHSSWSS